MQQKENGAKCRLSLQYADKKCPLRCGCGQKLQCKNGKNEATERENVQRLPGSPFDRHRAEIKQSDQEIKVNYEVD